MGHAASHYNITAKPTNPSSCGHTCIPKSQNNLDHRQMVLFHVLQKLVSTDVHSGHYFLIVLNLRNNRFEVLDSIRSLQNEKLTVLTTIINEIKKLWTIHYAGTQKQIENYEIVDIGVPKQGNNHDCGFHMLMHAQHWDGHSVCNIQGNDICNIGKILTHNWLTFEENDRVGKHPEFGIGSTAVDPKSRCTTLDSTSTSVQIITHSFEVVIDLLFFASRGVVCSPWIYLCC